MPGPKPRYTNAQAELAIRLARTSKSNREIARLAGISNSQLTKIYRQAGVSRAHARGPKNKKGGTFNLTGPDQKLGPGDPEAQMFVVLPCGHRRTGTVAELQAWREQHLAECDAQMRPFLSKPQLTRDGGKRPLKVAGLPNGDRPLPRITPKHAF